MHSKAIKEHRQLSQELNKQRDVSRASAEAAVENTMGTVLEPIANSINSVNRKQQTLLREETVLHEKTAKFAKYSQNWMNDYKLLNTSLKELSDVRPGSEP
jgi:hypothetical protein